MPRKKTIKKKITRRSPSKGIKFSSYNSIKKKAGKKKITKKK